MGIPISSTTITIYRPDQDGTVDDYDRDDDITNRNRQIAAGVRAVIGSPSGQELNDGGTSEIVTVRLQCDVTDLRHDDEVVDDLTGVEYVVIWAKRRTGLGVDHMAAELVAVTDRAGY